MASSEVEICNLALSWLAADRITSLDDPSNEAKLCKANYSLSRRAVLEMREWTFAIRRVSLNALTDVPLYEYSFTFLPPTDLLYSIGVYDPKNAMARFPEQTKHVFEHIYILANIDNVFLKYIYDETNTRKFSPLFDQALAAHIATNLAIPLTEKQGMFDRMSSLFLYNLDSAAASNGMQGTREQLNRSTLERSRKLQRAIA